MRVSLHVVAKLLLVNRMYKRESGPSRILWDYQNDGL